MDNGGGHLIYMDKITSAHPAKNIEKVREDEMPELMWSRRVRRAVLGQGHVGTAFRFCDLQAQNFTINKNTQSRTDFLVHQLSATFNQR